MAGKKPIIMKADPHTIAKHKILKTYLEAWMPIMSIQSQKVGGGGGRLLFVDGFAAAGIYEGGEPGSPIHAINVALKHPRPFPIPVQFLFIERERETCAKLKKIVAEYQERIDRSPNVASVVIREGDCEDVIHGELNRIPGSFGPAFVFLDQFGYSDVSMHLIRRIMEERLCEVFSYLNWNQMNRFLKDKNTWPAITKAFGGEEWKCVFKASPDLKASCMLDKYKRALWQKGCAKYVWHFAMCDKNGNLIYWLFFCTNHLRGLEKMKETMWRVDETGSFRFSDKDDPKQLILIKSYDKNMLARDLAAKLRGKVLTVFEVKEFTLTETPAHKFKRALELLERDKKLRAVTPPSGRKKGQFPDENMTVEFL